MTSAMEMVCNTLGIDRVNMDGKMILIEEQHGTNANFLLNAVLSHALKKMQAICLVLCHNTFGHYHNVGMRLGYNLLALKEKGQVTVVEPMKIVANNIADLCNDSMDKEEIVIPDAISAEHMDIVHKLFTCVKKSYDEAAKFQGSVVLIVDDINHLLDLGLSMRDTMYFVRYLRSSVASHPLSQLCILTHTYQWDPQTSNADAVANVLKHMAHLCVATKPFKTGHSSDTSGKLIVHWRIDSVRLKYHWPEETTHLFKLSDWQVKIYTSGAMSVLS
ncbi:elongator complex protein 6 [Linepithema humile]|uniref:elongator complex protein 6 n=1 Tax=Linepithema humile TaxID=83485 RepID=UPI00062362D2|nr:PREDICTED: elongator complex protein 6-like [Linepithema humile]XP_012220593.1 PREDICTED: elongator complex protein 6-like [Linepithema humile]